jgi:hypothetical protein
MRTRTVIAALAIAAATFTTLSAQAGPIFGRGVGMGMGHSGFGHGTGMRPGFGRIGVPANNPSALSRTSKIEALSIKQKVTDSRSGPQAVGKGLKGSTRPSAGSATVRGGHGWDSIGVLNYPTALPQARSHNAKRNSVTSNGPSNPQQGSDHGSVGLFQMQTR